MKTPAVLALIIKDNRILAVSRKEDHTSFGLPGGKVNVRELYASAVIREVKEETGYDINVHHIVYIDIERDRKVITFICSIAGGKEGSTESGVIKWVDWEELKKGSYGEYNTKLQQAYNEENKI